MDSPKYNKIDDLEVGVSRSGRVRKKSSKLANFQSSEEFSDRSKRQKMQQAQRSPDRFVVPGPSGCQKSRKNSSTRNAAEPESSSAESQFSESSEDSDENDSESEETETHFVSKRRIAKLDRQFPKNELVQSQIVDRGNLSLEKSKKNITVQNKKITNCGKKQRSYKGKTRFTAYMLWAKEARQKLVEQYPDLDFATISKRLGELWSVVPSLEKCSWGRRAKRLVFSSYTKSALNNEWKISSSLSYVSKNHNEKEDKSSTRRTRQSEKSQKQVRRKEMVEPIDVAAHLTLLGESLMLIGKLLEDDVKGVSVCGINSVLLDSLLCALGPLMCLTQFIPEANAVDPETFSKTLKNLAYIMPAL